MECPFCHELRYSGDWSKHQWNANWPHGSPDVEVNGWKRNCCRWCSNRDGWYFRERPAETERGSQRDAEGSATGETNTRGAAQSKSEERKEEKEHSRVRLVSPLTPPPSATCPLTQEEVKMKWEGASAWLQKNVGVEFWEKAENMWNDQNLKYRQEIEEVNAALGLKRKKNCMKHFSYWGAVKVDDWAMNWSQPLARSQNWSSPQYPGYGDIGNYWYAAVFKALWGKSHISSYSDATIGDHVEALLGWFIYLTWQYDIKFGERVHDILDMLNQAFFSAWVLGTFFP